VFRRSIGRAIGGTYEHSEALEGGLYGGTVTLAKVKDSNDGRSQAPAPHLEIRICQAVRRSDVPTLCSAVTGVSVRHEHTGHSSWSKWNV